MTRKDYDLLAACIGGSLSDSRNSSDTVYDLMRRLVCELRLDNPKFDVDKFSQRVEYWKRSHSNG